MILVFGGTTEGRQAVQVLDDAGATYYYSTRGRAQDISCVHGSRICGALESSDMETFCKEHGIRLLVDAAHPFAVNVHRNVMQTARKLKIPAIRYERKYPPRDKDLVWCKDYDDAVRQLNEHGINRLLALTGVQTISKLKPYWNAPAVDCHFRILNRDDSQQMALSQGFDTRHLVYYQAGNTAKLIAQIRPQAIITKESGDSGGFDEKITAARHAHIKVFVVCRPPLPEDFVCVNGPHGLRRKIEQLLPEFYPLKTGITTGTCATAAAKAAVTSLLENRVPPFVWVRIPNGEDIDIEVHAAHDGRASVVKFAGDDPDVTDGLEICATVKLKETPDIRILGGEGVGVVTLPGLGLEMGAPAINAVPQKMIRENIEPLLNGKGAEVVISVPDGKEVGARTFNPRIGVVNGISIVGTSGIVRPFSADAWISSIRKEMSVGIAMGKGRIVINSGAKSEKYLRAHYPELPEQAFIHYGNFIGETIAIAAELGVKDLMMGLMIGKAVKLAEGNLDTHSHKVTMNRAFVRQMAEEAGICQESLQAIGQINMARELWTTLSPGDMQSLAKVIIRHCHEHCDSLLPNGNLNILLIPDNLT